MKACIVRAGVAAGLLAWLQTGWGDPTQSAASQFKSFLNDIGNSAGQAVGQGVSNMVNGGGAAPPQPASPQPSNVQGNTQGSMPGSAQPVSTQGTASGKGSAGNNQASHRFTVDELISRARTPSCIQYTPSSKQPTMSMRIQNGCGESVTMVLKHQPIGNWPGGCSTTVLSTKGMWYNAQALDAEIMGYCPGAVTSYGAPCGCPSGGAFL